MLYKTKFPMGVHSSLDCALSPAVIRAASCSAAGPVAGSAANRAADTGDRAFGLNLLFYPHVADGAASSYRADAHVAGFRWNQQTWSHPDEDDRISSAAGVEAVATR